MPHHDKASKPTFLIIVAQDVTLYDFPHCCSLIYLCILFSVPAFRIHQLGWDIPENRRSFNEFQVGHEACSVAIACASCTVH
jgi:hypothetical protein